MQRSHIHLRRCVQPVVLLAAILLAASAGHAQSQGPFGLAMGLSKQDVETLIGSPLKASEGSSYDFTSKTVPRGLEAFEMYRLRILPQSGLCEIRAAGTDVRTSSHGIELVNAFDGMVGLLDVTYGKHGKSDFLQEGSIWAEPKDWMMALVKNERVLQAAWDAEERSTLKNGVKQILLRATALSSDVGYLVLQYEFDNSDACEAEIKSVSEGVL